MDNRTPIFQSIAVIEEKIREKLTVEKLAKSIHFSKFHYQRLFREIAGESVMRYVTRRRLLLAAGELEKTDASILEIALKYGYDSHEGFTRSFKAYMGVTPKEYRKYHLLGSLSTERKEEGNMKYSRTTDEIIRELNRLIADAEETAEFTRKNKSPDEETASYCGFWEMLAARAEVMAGSIRRTLERVSAVPRHPDEIAAQFMIIKAIEDAAFMSSVAAFQAGLVVARAQPRHRLLFEKLCEKYDTLARSARIKSERIAKLFRELSDLIFQDMRENAGEKIREAVAQGKKAAQNLWEHSEIPGAYIAEEVMIIANELEEAPLEEITVSALEDDLFRLDIILLAVDADRLRVPSCTELFEGIQVFRERMEEAAEFFRGLSLDISCVSDEEESKKNPLQNRSVGKIRNDAAFQGSILLFYLKGEVQKLGSRYLDREQRALLGTLCGRMRNAVSLLREEKNEGSIFKAVEMFQEIYGELAALSQELDLYGGAIRYIAEEIRNLEKHLSGYVKGAGRR